MLAEAERWDYRVEGGCPLVVAAELWLEVTGLRVTSGEKHEGEKQG